MEKGGGVVAQEQQHPGRALSEGSILGDIVSSWNSRADRWHVQVDSSSAWEEE